MVPREAGTPANDIAPVALLLAAAAILINACGPGQASGGVGADAARGRARRSAASCRWLRSWSPAWRWGWRWGRS